METTSPKFIQGVKADDKMDFYKAFKFAVDGKKIHKEEWKDKGYYGFLDGEILKLHKPDGKDYNWILSLGDLNGVDYILI